MVSGVGTKQGVRLGTEVLLALLDVGEHGLRGGEVQDRIALHGKRPPADALLAALLGLEATGHIAVDRSEPMSFALTPKGRDRAYELGGGAPVHVQLLMADLVDFVSFTSKHGDAAGRAAAHALHRAASDATRLGGGEIVKALGDGFLAWLPPRVDPLPVMRVVADGCRASAGERWRLRAASHVGHPIRHHRDLFGNDVNLVARLCQAAEPGELVRSTGGRGAPEHLRVRGFDTPVPVWREPVP